MKEPNDLSLPIEPIIFFQEVIEKDGKLAFIVVVHTSWRGAHVPPWTDLWIGNVPVFHRSQTTGEIRVLNGPAVSQGEKTTHAKVILPLVESNPEKTLDLTILLVDVARQPQPGEVVSPIIKKEKISYRGGLYGAKTQDLKQFLEEFGIAALAATQSVAPQPTSPATPAPTVQAMQPGFGPEPIVEPPVGPEDPTYVGDPTMLQTQLAPREEATQYGSPPQPRWVWPDVVNDYRSFGLGVAIRRFLWSICRNVFFQCRWFFWDSIFK